VEGVCLSEAPSSPRFLFRVVKQVRNLVKYTVFNFCRCSPHNLIPSPPVKHCINGTPTKRQVSKRQVSKRPVSKRLKRQVYKTSGLQNVWFTKCQVYKTSGLQNVRLQKKHPYIFFTFGWWKSPGSVAAMFAGKVMAVFYSLF
jgi:hypothetical protein